MPPTTKPAQRSSLPQWADVAAKLPKELKDTQYDAIRDGFFHSTLWPEMLKQGKAAPPNYGNTLTEFMGQTKRTGKSDYPRTRVAATAAADALLRPVASVAQQVTGKPLLEGMDRVAGEAALEAEKQGINPTAYQIGGTLAGAALPFAAIPGAAMSTIPRAMATGAASGALYGGLAAKPGERVQDALRDAAIGAALPAALGGAAKLLKGRPTVPAAGGKGVIVDAPTMPPLAPKPINIAELSEDAIPDALRPVLAQTVTKPPVPMESVRRPSVADFPMRERPTGTMGTTGGAPIPGVPENVSAVTFKTGEGKAASVFRIVDRDTVHHESTHRNILAAGVDDAESLLGSVDPDMSGALKKAIPTDLYETTANEEVFARLHAAIATKNRERINAFVAADGGEDEVMEYAVKTGQRMLSELSRRPDTPMKAMAMRRLQHTVRRASRSIDDIRAQAEMVGDRVEVRNGRVHYFERGGQKAQVFDDNGRLQDFLDKRDPFPENAPEFLPASDTLPGTPLPPPTGGPNYMRFSTDDVVPSIEDLTPGKPMPGAPGSGRVRGGGDWLFGMVTPKLQWISGLAKKYDLPEFYTAAVDLDNAQRNMHIFLKPWLKELHEIFTGNNKARRIKTKLGIEQPLAYEGGIKPRRYHDVFEYLFIKEAAANGHATAADVTAAEAALGLSKKEMLAVGRVRDWLDRMGKEMNVDPLKWIGEYLPRLRKNSFDPDFAESMGKALPKEVLAFWEHDRTGLLDNRETNLLKVLYRYAHDGARSKFMNEPYQRAKDILTQKRTVQKQVGSWNWKDSKVPVAGEVNDILHRHLEFMIGRPDKSALVMEKMVQRTLDILNDGIDSINRKTPEKWRKLPNFTESPGEALSKFMLLQTAGGLGFRPLVPIRDMFQIFLAYPMLGEKYLAVALGKAVTKETRQLAEKYGAVAPDMGAIMNAVTGGAPTGSKMGMAARVSEAAMTPQKWSSNLTRMAAFRGFWEKVGDAAPALRSPADVPRFMRQSGAQWLDPQMGQMLAAKYLAAPTAEARKDVVGEIAMRLTEISQWSWVKGAQPAAYQYQIGRILGQYGTWPANYVGYVRRFARGDIDGIERAKAISRFALINAAVYEVAKSAGVDAGNMIFTQPAAYAGGPMFTAAANLPQAVFDWDTSRGPQARHAVKRAVGLTVPGYVYFGGLFDAVANDDPRWYEKLLGVATINEQKERTSVYARVSQALEE